VEVREHRLAHCVIDRGDRLVEQALGFFEMHAVARRPPEQVARLAALIGLEPIFVLGEGRQRVLGVAAGKQRQVAARERAAMERTRRSHASRRAPFPTLLRATQIEARRRWQ